MPPLLAAFVIVVSSLGLLAAVRWNIRCRQKAFLLKPLTVESLHGKQATSNIGLTEIAPPAISTFDVLYNMSKIDPHCLRGIDHLHHAQHFSNLGDLMGFLKSSVLPEHLDGAAWRSVIHKYKGYAGEEVVFDHLQAGGHQVERAVSGTQSGHDAVVDGHFYNIKVTDDPAYIGDHLREHPDVDVITNSEMGDAFAANPHVHIDQALSAQDVFHSTADTFGGIHDMGSLFHHIPLITTALSGARNTRSVLAGRKTVTDAAAHTAIDTASVGMGGFGGAKLGLLIGLALAPVTGGLSAVAATASCTLLGSIGGVFAGRSIGSWFKSRHLRELQQFLEKDAANLRNAFVGSVDEIVAAFRRSHDKQAEIYRNSQKRLQNWFLRIVSPSTLTTFYSLACDRTKNGFREWQSFYRSIQKEVVSKCSEVEAGLCVYSYGRDTYACSTAVTSAWDSVHDRLMQVEKERFRIS
jgi:hypothetical protein